MLYQFGFSLHLQLKDIVFSNRKLSTYCILQNANVHQWVIQLKYMPRHLKCS